MAQYLLSGTYDVSYVHNDSYISTLQGDKSINVSDFMLFIENRNKRLPREEILNKELVGASELGYIQLNQDLNCIAEGYDIWNSDDEPAIVSDNLNRLSSYYIKFMSSFLAITHSTERAVKLANHCSNDQRSELERTKYAISSFSTSNQVTKNIMDNYSSRSSKKKEPNVTDVSHSKLRSKTIIKMF